MVDRLNKAYFGYSPTVAQSASARSSNDVFAGVTSILSGTSTGVVTGVDVRSESVVFLGAPIFTTAPASGSSRGFCVTSMTINTAANSGAAGFMITTVDSLGAGTSVRIPWTVWRIGQVNPV
jgi:hypothetical protein